MADINSQSRIIDRDVEFYRAEVEHCRERLARCYPEFESYWVARAEYAGHVYSALVLYRAKVDAVHRP